TGFYFDPSRHDFSAKTFLGHSIACSGMAEGEQALDILARSPATARHLSFQLAQYFVADDPPKPLVDRMTQHYLDSDGDIREVLATIFTSSEFWDRRCYAAKFKSPYEYVISSVRATGVEVRNYRPLYGTMQLLGMPLYACQTPNGYSNTQDAWLNADAMMMRISFATALVNGNLPLDHPPFVEDESGRDEAMRPVAAKIGGGMKLDYSPENPGKMPPPEATALTHTLGDSFSASTNAGVEAAPLQLRTALILGSPEFMKR